MTDPAAPGSGAVACWNCGQPLQAGSARCLWCGVPQEGGAPPLLIAPAGAPSGAQPGAAASGPPSTAVAAGGVPETRRSRAKREAAVAAPTQAVFAAATRPPLLIGSGGTLGPEFSGTIASTAARVIAFSIDAVIVALVSTVVLLVTGSLAFAVLCVVELALGFWVLQARTGLTPGQALLGLRTSRDSMPYSPGAAASLLRAGVMALGLLAAGVGAWVVVASSAFDGTGRRRSWADRASRTIVVAVPPRIAQPASPYLVTVTSTSTLTPSAASASGSPLAAGVVPVSGPATNAPVLPTMPTLAPRVISITPPVSPIDEESASAVVTGAVPPNAGPTPVAPATSPPQSAPAPLSTPAPAAPVTPPQAVPPASVTPAPLPPAAVPAQAAPAPVAPAPVLPAPVLPAATTATPTPAKRRTTPDLTVPAEAAGGAVLLVFDTGQREQVTIPAAINLGRNPVATEAGDALISVRDPDSTVSKTHARIEHAAGRTFITDRGSTNGTEVISDEGVVTLLAPEVRTEVPPGARLRIGKRAFTVSVLLGDNS